MFGIRRPPGRPIGVKTAIPLAPLAVMLAACGAPATHVATAHTPSPATDDLAVQRQLEGHLARARGCYDEARRRRGDLAGWIRVAVRISPDSHASEAEVLTNTSGDAQLAECMRTRLSALYFDPAPTQAVERVHDFVLCPHDAPGLCELGPIRAVEGAGPDGAVAEAIGGRAADIERCAADTATTDDAAVLDIELRLDPDGRILSGRVRDSVPASTPLRACAVRPLLGLSVPDVTVTSPVTYRVTYALRPTDTDPPPTVTAARE